MSYEKIKALIIQSKLGDEDAINELIATYDKLIKRYVDTYFIKGYDDEDLLQIVKLTIIQAAKKYDTEKPGNFTSFLDVYLRNTFTTMINKKENTVYTVSLNKIMYEESGDIKEYVHILVDDMNVLEDTVYKDEKMRLRQALDKLSAEDRELIIVAFSGHGKLKEYANRKGISYRQARYGRDRVLEMVRREMEGC